MDFVISFVFLVASALHTGYMYAQPEKSGLWASVMFTLTMVIVVSVLHFRPIRLKHLEHDERYQVVAVGILQNDSADRSVLLRNHRGKDLHVLFPTDRAGDLKVGEFVRINFGPDARGRAEVITT